MDSTVTARSLTLDAPGLGVTADDQAEFLDLAERGLVGSESRGCNAVQDDKALRADTRVSLGTTLV